mgnify:CR=1 FL=1
MTDFQLSVLAALLFGAVYLLIVAVAGAYWERSLTVALASVSAVCAFAASAISAGINAMDADTRGGSGKALMLFVTGSILSGLAAPVFLYVGR